MIYILKHKEDPTVGETVSFKLILEDELDLPANVQVQWEEFVQESPAEGEEPPRMVTPPVAVGEAVVGENVIGHAGSYSGDGTLDVSVQWQEYAQENPV
jgi:hypothetical protein